MVPPLTRAKLGASHFKLSSHVAVLHNPCPVIGSSSLKTDSVSFLMCYGHQSCPEATAAVTFALSFAGKRWLLVRAKAVRISSRSSLNALLPGCRPSPIECLYPKVPAPGKTTPYGSPYGHCVRSSSREQSSAAAFAAWPWPSCPGISPFGPLAISRKFVSPAALCGDSIFPDGREMWSGFAARVGAVWSLCGRFGYHAPKNRCMRASPPMDAHD